MVGKSLSHYHITAELGRGGMGIVYKAEDTKLDRTVAIKVLPSAALSSEDDRARFYREAKAAAALTHPNIAIVHAVDEAVPEGSHSDDLRPFIAMEFIAGETLEERIASGPLKLKEVVRIAGEIASGLGAAHKKEIVHRDIKAANIMLDEDGTAKILDFGLAQTAQSTKLTQMGSTLGTVAYMSPEQARGEEVDLRTDFWALGAVLYEMIAGCSAFPGDYEQAVVYSILNQDPEPLTALRTGVPMELEAIVRKCLRKDAGMRYQTAADLVADLSAVVIQSSPTGSISAMHSVSSIDPAAPVTSGESKPSWFLPVVTLGGLLLLIAAAFLGRWTTPTPGPVHLDMTIRVQPLETLFNGPAINGGLLGLSPDGARIAFVGLDDAGPGLFISDLSDGAEPMRLTSTGVEMPSFSPDGLWIAYYDQGGIYKTSTRGGEPQLLTKQVADITGLSWGSDGYIYYVPDYGSGILRLYPEGSRVETMVEPRSKNDETGFSCPSILPDHRSILSGRYGRNGLEIVLIDIGTKKRTILARGMCPSSSGDGGILFAQGPRLMGATLGADGSLSEPHPITDALFANPTQLNAQYAASASGDLYFIEGTHWWGRNLEFRRWDGSATKLDVGRDLIFDARISPDGKKLVATSNASVTEDIELFVFNLDDGDLRRMTNTSAWEGFPNWVGDSESIIYGSERAGQADIYEMSLLGDEQLIFADSTQKYPKGISADGKLVGIYSPSEAKGGIYVLNRSTEEYTLIVPGSVEDPAFSPDGRFIMYRSDESGMNEIYSIDYPPTRPRKKISTDGGSSPRFDRSGSHVYYLKGTSLMRAALDKGGARVGDPEVALAGVTSFYDLLPDGTGILTHEDPDTRTVRYIRNWQAGLTGN